MLEDVDNADTVYGEGDTVTINFDKATDKDISAVSYIRTRYWNSQTKNRLEKAAAIAAMKHLHEVLARSS